MDRTTVFTKTAKGLMEATGKTSVLARDLRLVLKEIDGKATVAEVQARLDKIPEAKLQETLDVLAKGEFIREFSQAAPAAARPPVVPRPKGPAAGEMDLDFTAAIPTLSTAARQAEEAARQKAQAAAAAESAARTKTEAAARAKAEAEAKAKAEALEKAKAAAQAKAKAEAETRARAEAEAKARAAAAEAAARAKAEAEARAKAEAEARAKAEAEARAKREAEEQARREAEQKARTDAEERAKAQEQARIEAEARARKEAEERARVEAELKARLEEERRAREEAERKAKEEAERARKAAEEKARREADELRASLEQERRAREDAERRVKEQAEGAAREAEERARKAAEEKARREADELRASLEQERRAREEAERRVKEEAERRAKEQAEGAAREAEERARKAAEEKARREADELRSRLEQERRAREEAERKAKEEAERRAKEQAEGAAREAEGRARKEKEELARREAEAGASKDAEDRSRREDQEKTRKDAEDKARREAAEQARQQAPTESGRSLDDLVKIETDFDAVLGAGSGIRRGVAKILAGDDGKMIKEVEEKERKVAEEKARSAAEEKAHRETGVAAPREDDERKQAADRVDGKPEAREQEHAEMQARLKAEQEETERHFAEMEKELEAERAAAKVEPKKAPEPRQDAREYDNEEAVADARAETALHGREARAAAEEAPVAYRTPINWHKPVALGLLVILILGLVLVHFVSFDGQIAEFEKLAGAHLQQPVKIKALHLSLVPLPHWRLDGVSVGQDGRLEVAQIKAVAELGSMFSDKKAFSSIELESPVLSEEGLFALLFGKPQGQNFKVASVIVRNGKLNSKSFVLPVLDAKIAVGENGAWQKIALETPDHKTTLLLEPKGEGAQIEVETNALSLPFGPDFSLENFVAKGMVVRNELQLSEFKGGVYGGYLSGNASLKWGADWSLGGEIRVRAMDPGKFAAALLEDGRLEGRAAYAMRAKSYDELFAAPRLEGTVEVQKGSLLGVDLARLLQGGGVGGKTAFTELTASFIREGDRTQLRQVRVVAGPVSAGGSADVDAGKNISGRFAADLKSPVAQARVNFAVSGSLREPRFSR